MARNFIHYLKIAFIIYAGALVLSWIIQIYFPTSDKPNLYQKEKTIVVDGAFIDYRYFHLENSQSNKTIFLLPDLFGKQDFLLPLAGSLQDSMNVIIPEYPQTTMGNRSVSHSVTTRAKFLSALRDSLNLEDVYLLGHGYGGLAAIHLASGTQQQNYQGLVLLSSYGTQELQFLGNHTINRSLYTMLYPVVAFFEYLTPHMGWYYEQPVDFAFMKTLIELDQRPVRGQLKQIEIPVHILQPVNDRYISLSIASEIHRLIPHSTMFAVEGNHNTSREIPVILSPQVHDFVNRVDTQQAITRGEADKERLQAVNETFDAEKFSVIGGWTLAVIMFLLIIISLLSEDLSCVAGGLLVASGVIDFWFAVLGCSIGALGGDVATYFLGRWIGNPILRWVPFRWFIKEQDIDRAEKMFRMRGMEIIFLTRFIPGTRFPVYLVSGIVKANFTSFILYFILALIIWAPALVGISALIGQPMISYLASYQEYALWLAPVILGVIYCMIKGIILISTPTGRRKVVVKTSRFKERYFGR